MKLRVAFKPHVKNPESFLDEITELGIWTWRARSEGIYVVEPQRRKFEREAVAELQRQEDAGMLEFDVQK